MIGIGIDVSKNKSTVAAIRDTGEIIMKLQEIRHNHTELNNLIKWIRDQDDMSFVVMESTGHYHYPVVKKLYEEGVPVSVVNAYLLKKYGDTEIRKVKTDKKDAIRIAKYAIEKRYSLTRYEGEDNKKKTEKIFNVAMKDLIEDENIVSPYDYDENKPVRDGEVLIASWIV